ncbi:MAG: hypothetical protein ACTSPY_02490 [Candidatus Helarchaeota archaeon]
MNKVDLDDIIELEQVKPPIDKLNIILKIIDIENPILNPNYNEITRDVILADRTGAIKALLIRVGKGLQIADVIAIKDAKIIQENKSEYKMIITKEPEIVDGNIPVINQELIFDDSDIEENEIEIKMDHEIIELNEMKKELFRYNIRVQVLTEPTINQKYLLGKLKKYVEIMVGDMTGCLPLIINDLDGLNLDICDEIEVYNALLDYRITNSGPELYLTIDNFKDQVLFIRKYDKIFTSRNQITIIEPELNYINEINEIRRKLHLKCEILSIDLPIKRKIQNEEIDYTTARVGDETGSILLKLWGNNATKFKRGDKIQILSGYVSIDRWTEKKLLDIDSTGMIRSIQNLPDNFKVGTEDYSILTNDEYEEFLESFNYTTIEDIELDGNRYNFIVKIIESYTPIYLSDKTGMNSFKLEKFLVGDETGCVYLALINNQKIIRKGDVIRLFNFYTKIRGNDIFLETDRLGKVKIIENDVINKVSDEILCVEGEFTPINNIKTKGTYNLKAKVVNISPEIIFKGSDKKDHKFVKVELMDQTGNINLVLFDDQIKKIQDTLNKYIEISNCYLDKYKSELHLKLTKLGNIRIIENE